ncbi:MAG: hypothetical protein HYZ61_02700 [Candidatus Andersenbacteria bacterium]|nr:hypothetical protein [Candidatus Andersenbacteria bacterium]
MSFGSFIFGFLIMIVGMFMVIRTNWFLENLGDLGSMIGVYDKSWLSWKAFGVFLIFLGFSIAFSLFTILIKATIGQLFVFGGL